MTRTAQLSDALAARGVPPLLAYALALHCYVPQSPAQTESYEMDDETTDELNHPAILSARQTCSGCPDQWEGETHDGRAFYFRYRSGVASLAVGPDRKHVSGVTRAEQAPQGLGVRVSVMAHGDRLDGMFASDAERSEVFRRLWGLIPQSPESTRAALGRDPEDIPEEPEWHKGCKFCWRTIWHASPHEERTPDAER